MDSQRFLVYEAVCLQNQDRSHKQAHVVTLECFRSLDVVGFFIKDVRFVSANQADTREDGSFLPGTSLKSEVNSISEIL